MCLGQFQQIVLDGEPWSQNSSFGLHGRSAMILVLRAANSRGWNMIASADVSAKTHRDVKQLFNRQSLKPYQDYFMTFNRGDKKPDLICFWYLSI
jgi:hypothetical protein